MNSVIRVPVIVCFSLFMLACTSGNNHGNYVTIITNIGDIKIRLYDETPIHRDNFIKLVNMHFYDGISFHRVIQDFMIQAGDGLTRIPFLKSPNDSLNSYTIPSEFRSGLFHKKGALAAAREGNDVNPEMRSSGTQFYIVQGKTYTAQDLDNIEKKINNNIRQNMFVKFLNETADSNKVFGFNLKDEEIQERASLRLFYFMEKAGDYKMDSVQRNVYMKSGGTPRLDQAYTVFGEVVGGLDIVDKIAAAKTDQNDKPLNDIKIIKMKLVRK
jgi:peptidylprolyl isomerase